MIITHILDLFRRQPRGLSQPDADQGGPKPGEVWKLNDRDEGDPFGPIDSGITCQILDVRAGWVRYWSSALFPDERRPVDSFMKLYRRQQSK